MNNLSDQITACLVVHNEEAVIERCLQSLEGITERIVVVHDGACKDETLAICEKYGCEIYVRPWVGMCEGHRVFSFEQAKTPWILLIDADEYLSEGLKKALPDLVKKNDISAYDFYWPYWDGSRQRTTTWPLKRALFRRDKFSYLAFPHGAIHARGASQQLPLVLEHRPLYDNFSAEAYKAKHKKWIGIHADYFLKDWDSLPRYPEHAKELKPNYAILRKWPRLAAPYVFLYHFAGLWCLGGWKAGRIGLRNAFFQASYYFKLGFEISRQKKARLRSE